MVTQGSFKPRKWQQQFIDAYGLADKPEFLAVASVGAGKTHAAMNLLAQMPSRRMLVVAPKLNVVSGWCSTARQHGFHAHPGYEPGLDRKVGLSADKYRVVAVTYQALAMSPHLYRMLTATGDWLVVFDEIHHLDTTGGAWGSAAEQAFKTAGKVSPNIRVLGLSGTPWRTEGDPIPFVNYIGDRVNPDYSYSYAAAVSDRVVRRPQFVAIDADAQIMGPDGFKELRVEDARGNDIPRVIRSAIHHESEWLYLAIKQGYEMVQQDRAGLVPNAAMIIHTKDISTAREVAQVTRTVTGSDAVLVTSGENDSGDEAAGAIARFAASNDPVLVAVDMASEGTDIPRLTVGIHATNVRTRMDFEQRFGRLVRLTESERAEGARHAVAKYIIPAAQPHVEYARSIYDEVNELLRDKQETEDRDYEGDAPPPPTPVLPASNADVSGIYSDGALVTDMESWEKSGQLAMHFGIDQVEAYRVMTSKPPTKAQAPVSPPVDLKVKEKQLRAALNRTVNRLARRQYWNNHGDAWAAVKRHAGIYGELSAWTVPQIEDGIKAASELMSRGGAA